MGGAKPYRCTLDRRGKAATVAGDAGWSVGAIAVSIESSTWCSEQQWVNLTKQSDQALEPLDVWKRSHCKVAARGKAKRLSLATMEPMSHRIAYDAIKMLHFLSAKKVAAILRGAVVYYGTLRASFFYDLYIQTPARYHPRCTTQFSTVADIQVVERLDFNPHRCASGRLLKQFN